MHEVSIALSMMDELARIAKENNAKHIIAVNLRIGNASGIVTDSLKFAFDAIKLENPLISTAEIFIEEVPLEYECKECKNSFQLESIHFPSCPFCKSYKLKLLSGEEMDIVNIELEV
ncbi:MAG: hydrogenase maturation nickel metallochaperone HypA [Thermodesulfovibrionia bacterium]|nr:hydrogenase maturation nickel metallochaperone HypA [Thermodesulfovibrionia bacterium]